MIKKKNNSGESSAPRTALDIFCSNLSQTIHYAAQPLSVLRASLFKGCINRMTKGELREHAANSAIEVERVCTLFSSLQQFLNIERVKPDLSATQILPLLEHVADRFDLLYKEDGMLLKSMLPYTCGPVLINRERTVEALSSVMFIAHSISRPQDTIELIASSLSKTVRVMVQNSTLYVDRMDAQSNVGMAVAEANIKSQGAEFSLSLEPFQVKFKFPIARS